MIDYKLIGGRIKKARKANKMTQEYLSEKLDVSAEYISRLENGASKINLEMLCRIAAFLNVKPESLLSGASMGSDNYFHHEMAKNLKKCSPAKIRVIADIIKKISDL